MKAVFTYVLFALLLVALPLGGAYAQDHGDHDHEEQAEEGTPGVHTEGHAACACHEGEHEEAYDAGASAFHHISDANVFHLWGDTYLPLPVILYAPGQGWTTFMANRFELHEHGTGTKAIDRYVLVEGSVMHIDDPEFPGEEVTIDCISSSHGEDGVDKFQVIYKGECYPLNKKSSFDGGFVGGGITSFYDFSITKNVFTMMLVTLILFLIFRSVATAYQRREGQPPRGLQGFIEPFFTFIRDEVAIPFLGKHHEKYLPFLMSIFFFILGLNLIGQIPFFPGSGNVTGNLGVTMVLALFTFFVVNFSGNKHYWQHIFWMPGVPAPIKLILTPVEVLGLFIKPLTLMLRLFANITAGHVVIIIFVSLIFIFGNAGESIGGSVIGGVMAVPLTMFMMSIELLVAFIQAFVFCILTASYISAAVEEHHAEDVPH